MAEAISEPYRMRGHRVVERSPQYIHTAAKTTCDRLGIERGMDMAMFMDSLYDKIGINIEVEFDANWHIPASAACEPDSLRIVMPEKLYRKICNWNPRALSILFHELGHIALGHKPLLHYSNEIPSQEQDAEWQADFFADAIMRKLKIEQNPKQREFDFDT